MQTLDCLWPILERKGWYVIEDMDLHSFPTRIIEWHAQRQTEIRELNILKNKSGGSLITFIKKQ